MRIISHRGNLNGKDPEKENHPDYILNALKAGYDVEIDLWHQNNNLYLGHDNPQYDVDIKFLCQPGLWIHAKNIDSIYFLNTNYSDLNYFFHDTDDCVLTSKGYLWTYIGKQLTPKSIAVMPEKIVEPYDLSYCYGICTDFPIKYNNYYVSLNDAEDKINNK